MTDEELTETGFYKPCPECGYPFAQPAGACHICPECGESTGCS